MLNNPGPRLSLGKFLQINLVVFFIKIRNETKNEERKEIGKKRRKDSKETNIVERKEEKRKEKKKKIK